MLTRNGTENEVGRRSEKWECQGGCEKEAGGARVRELSLLLFRRLGALAGAMRDSPR